MLNGWARALAPTPARMADPRFLQALAWARKGYMDAANGRPLSHDDAPSRSAQLSYERCRLLAVNMKAAGFQLENWPEGQPAPHRVQVNWTEASIRFGNPLPPLNLPPAAVQR